MSRLVIQNANYFDSIAGNMVSDKTIVVEGGIIVWIGDTSSYEKESGDQLLDSENKFVLPGLIDCHVHVESYMGLNYEREYLRTNTQKLAYNALFYSQEHLKSGFTTIRDCGGGNWGSSLRSSFEEHQFYGPRLLVAQNFVSQWGNQEAIGPDEIINDRQQEIMTGKNGIMHIVRERKRQGSDFIKTATTGGVLHGVKSGLDFSFWREEELNALVDEAHRMNMHVAAHAHGDIGILEAAKAGIDTIEHGSFVSEESMKYMIKNNTYLVPTQTSAFIDKPELMTALPPEVAEKTKKVDNAMFKNHKIAFEAGVKIALGTDAGVPGNPHGSSAREISSMVFRIGMTPEQALQTATIEAARAIKLDSLVGSLEIDKAADMIIVNKNPLEDITILEKRENLSNIIKDGIEMVRFGQLLQ